MADAAIACRAIVDLPWFGLGIGHEFLQVLGRHVRVHQQGQRLHRGASNRREILERGVRQAAVQRRVDHHHTRVGQHQGVAVGRRLHHVLRAHRAASTGLVVHHHRLAQHGLQFIGQQAGMLVQRATRRKADHDAHGLGRKRVHSSRPGQGCAYQQGAKSTQGVSPLL